MRVIPPAIVRASPRLLLEAAVFGARGRSPTLTSCGSASAMGFDVGEGDVVPAVSIARERHLKRWTARKKEALVAGDLETVKTLSQRR